MAVARRGFTLIELLVVMVIIVLLIGLGVGGYGHARREARESAAKAGIEKLRTALTEYRAEYGGYPPHPSSAFSDMLDSLPTEQTDAFFDSVDGLELMDPWGRPYQYLSTNRFLYSIWSTGQDETDGSDDIDPSKAGY